MLARYVRLMDALNRACVFVAGVCLVVITVIIPYGVFCRYVLNSAASWPEPMAVLLMIVLSFLSAVVCYREYLHIGVGLLPKRAQRPPQACCSAGSSSLCMLATNVFMLWYGIKLIQVTWYQSIAEFPLLSVGCRLSADPHRRRDHAAVRDRAAVDATVLRRALRPKPSAPFPPSERPQRA